MPRSRTKHILTAPIRGIKALAAAIFQAPNPFGAWNSGQARITRRVGDGSTNSIVVATIGWLQRNFPQAPLRVSQRAADGVTWTPIEAGEQGAGRMLTVLEDPNPYYDWATLTKASIASVILDGNYYWMIVRNGIGAPIQYWWIPNALIEPARREGSNEFLTHYVYTPGGSSAPIDLLPEDVIHHRDGIDPENPLKGLSRVKAVLQEVLTDEEAAAYTSTLLGNMGVPGIVVSPSDSSPMMNASEEDLRSTKAKFEAATTGGNRGRVVVMNGATDLKTFGFNPQQMSLRDLRQVPEERITAAIGIPAIVAGMGAGLARSTFSNFGEARETAVEEALIPLWGDVARTIKKQVLPDFVGAAQARKLRVDFDLSEVRVLRDDQDAVVDRMTKLVGAGIATRAQAKEKAGLPVDAGDDVYLMPFNIMEVPVGQSVASMTPDPKGMKAVAVASEEVNRLSQQQQARLIGTLEREQLRLADVFEKRLVPLFEELGDLVSSAWSEEGVEVKALKKSDPEVRASYGAAVARVMERANVGEWAKKRLNLAFQQHYTLVAEETVKTLGATIRLEVGSVDEVAVTVVAEGGTRAGLVNVTKQTEEAIYQAIAEARAETLGPKDIERRIRSLVEGGPSKSVSNRAMRIARTETRHAQSLSTRTSYQVSGAYDSATAWDNRTGYNDADCVARNGQTYDFDEASRQDAMEHPNGTLGWAPDNVIG